MRYIANHDIKQLLLEKWDTKGGIMGGSFGIQKAQIFKNFP